MILPHGVSPSVPLHARLRVGSRVSRVGRRQVTKLWPDHRSHETEELQAVENRWKIAVKSMRSSMALPMGSMTIMNGSWDIFMDNGILL